MENSRRQFLDTNWASVMWLGKNFFHSFVQWGSKYGMSPNGVDLSRSQMVCFSNGFGPQVPKMMGLWYLWSNTTKKLDQKVWFSNGFVLNGRHLGVIICTYQCTS